MIGQAKRVLGVAGSARNGGNSAKLLRAVLDDLARDFQTELISLADWDIGPCNGCHYCETHGVCRLSDDMPVLGEKLKAADAILLAAPAYMGGVASRMQAFLERTWPLRKGQLEGKVGSYIVTGRRRIGMAVGVMEEYFTRVRMTKLPGILGYAFELGAIEQDQEAIGQVPLLATSCRNYLNGTSERNT